jgi:hypothetical protein
MSAQQALGEESGLLFAWEHPTHRKVALIGFIVASLLFHALCFYAFQIIYPPTVALLPPPGRVTLIAPTNDESRRLLRWIEAEDPALASTTQRLPTTKSLAMPTIQHAPSYLLRQPTLREIPPDAPDPAIPSAHPPGPVEPLRPLPQPVTKAVPTIVRLSAGLETLGPLQSPKMNFKLAGAESPQVAQFRLGVDKTGVVRFCFVDKSSGNASLDEQAREYLSLSRFPPIEKLVLSLPKERESKTENNLTWGLALVEWGNDLFAPPPSPESSAP